MAGARHSTSDQKHLDEAMTHLQAAGAQNGMSDEPMTKATDIDSMEEVSEDLRESFISEFNPQLAPQPMSGPYVVETYPAYVIVCDGDEYYQVAYAKDPMNDDNITWGQRDTWVLVEKQWTPTAETESTGMKANADFVWLNMATPVIFGAVKASGDEWRLDVLGVPFGGPMKGKDVEGQYFSQNTNTHHEIYPEIPVYYYHGYDSNLNPQGDPVIIGKATYVKQDAQGHWYDVVLDKTKEFAERVWKAANTKPLPKAKASSGTIAHIMRVDKSSGEITNWPVVEMTLMDGRPGRFNAANSYAVAMPAAKAAYEKAGLTFVTPPEQGDNAITQKDAQTDMVEAVKAHTSNAADATITTNPKESKMELTKEELQQMLADTAKQASAETLRAVKAAEPAPNTAGTDIHVTHDEADTPFANLAENARAVKAYFTSGTRTLHPRLSALLNLDGTGGMKAAAGASEGNPSDGGILLDPTLTSEFLAPIHNEGPFSNTVRKLPVSSNSNYGWINGVNETDRSTGSRWGGVRGYRMAEAGSITGSKPTFRRIQWELKKYAVLVYGSDELIADSSQFSTVVNQGCREELNFMVNDDIMNGIGLAGPQGFMNSGALITVTRDTGSAIKAADIKTMWNRLDPRARKNATWYIGNDSRPQIDELFASGSTALWFPYLTIDPITGSYRLYGRPVVDSEFNASLNTTGDIVLADMSQYLFWDKNGVESATSIHLQFLTDETTFRFTYRCDGKSSLASALTPYKGSTTTSPFVALTSAT